MVSFTGIGVCCCWSGGQQHTATPGVGPHQVHVQMVSACSCQGGCTPYACMILGQALGLPERSCCTCLCEAWWGWEACSAASRSSMVRPGTAARGRAPDRASAACGLELFSLSCALSEQPFWWRPEVEQHCNASAPRLTSLSSSMAVLCSSEKVGAPTCCRRLPSGARARRQGCQRGARGPA